ncbi:MAG TPA: DUF2845 domain-containing protein [Steroidobacteraceae bacterium]|nr:DUF2845 domain-containing protein [Steroidobacteraceae bacterium]
MKRSALVLVLALCAGSPAFAALRCGTKLVSEGDTRAEVTRKCGEPTEVVPLKSVFRRPMVWANGQSYYVGEDFIEIRCEAWVYNLGPNKLMRRLKFEDGVLTEIESLGYGYNP